MVEDVESLPPEFNRCALRDAEQFEQRGIPVIHAAGKQRVAAYGRGVRQAAAFDETDFARRNANTSIGVSITRRAWRGRNSPRIERGLNIANAGAVGEHGAVVVSIKAIEY